MVCAVAGWLQTVAAKAEQVSQVLVCLEACEADLAAERDAGAQLQQALMEQQVRRGHHDPWDTPRRAAPLAGHWPAYLGS